MSGILFPTSAGELGGMLRTAASARRSIGLFGANSKRLMGGPVAPADVQISTAGMKRILQYEPRDLTISVEAGIPYAELSRELARNGQMIPLAGPYAEDATIGGIVAANISDSRRRGYGTARDLVIGMEFATVEGKLVKSGGMVVKNVAGLDMGKLMIGSFGTLAAIATLNFKLLPIPTVSRTLTFEFADLRNALAVTDSVMKGGLNPSAIDLLNPALAARLNKVGFVLAIQFCGNDAVIERSAREATGLWGEFGTIRELADDDERIWWADTAAITPRFLEQHPGGCAARIATPISETVEALQTLDIPAHAMVASGVVRGWFADPEAASRWLEVAAKRGWKGVIEFAGPGVDRTQLVQWPGPGGDFEIMKRIKHLFDPAGLLNRGRLHGRI